MPKFLIVGASRGIGRGLVEALCAAGNEVIATSRDSSAAVSGATWLPLDIRDEGSRDRLARHPFVQGVTDVVVAVGVMPKDVDATLAQAVVADVFATNSVAPVALGERLIAAASPPPRRLVFLGSRMGSVALNEDGDHWIYRASKAALLSAAKSLHARRSADGVAVSVVHPGWVRTQMGGADADIDVATSVRGLLALLDAPPAEGFRFCDYRGTNLPY